MIEFFREGGFGMWAVLVFGLILVGTAVRFAARPERHHAGFLGAMALTLLVTVVHATWTDLGAVFGALSDSKRVPDAELTRTLWEGLKECTRPGAFGGGMLSIACLLFAVGLLRMNRREA